ncbi:multidrug resistance-associated 1-like, partial [Paramuricea clavata]
KESPEEKANIFSMLTFWWMTQLVWLGFRRPLISKDLWCLKGSLWSQNIGSKFDKYWKEEKERVLRKLERHQSGKMTSVANGRTSSATDERQNLNDEVKYSSDERKEYHPSLIKTLWKVFGRSLIPAFFLKLCCDTLTFVQPQLLGAIIEFIDDRDQRELWEGILYAGGMFVVALFQTLVLQQYFKIVMITGLSIRTAVLGIIYRKALVLSTVSRNQSTVGEMVNLMSVDAQRLMDILTYINMLWSAPYQISLAIFFLYRTMGISVLAGVAVMLVLFPINFFIGRRMRKFQ